MDQDMPGAAAPDELLIAPIHEWMARLCWPGWLVTYRSKCPSPGVKPGHGHPSKY